MALLGIDFACALESLRDGGVPDRDCVLSLLSKLVGYCLIAASTTVKLPQILKILKNRSARGLSILSFELDVVGYTIALAYCLHKGLHFSAYGELVFLLIQSIILVAVIYYYSQPLGAKTWTKTLLHPGTLRWHQRFYLACQHAIFFCARVPQIWKNFTTKSTGQLSFLTASMNFGGSVARVFTGIQEKAPMSVVLGTMRTVVTNGTILSQIIIYRKPREEREKKVE
ncbi:mannose-P-dolichol utilization defect 1 protein homolog 2 isoform X2 [Eucalyptus grandis]|uniref:mannose-P-dolichol utilization defect 1 protein homolog 2 isoform X2 n=1 Tax=Eucalyptus grandis TaxID=71139 RepID=UPI00192F03D4|nr:mannose-P-dolichol utilization defect 1 protein homolog 2 isoform X2 [Eucalyptus grandis]